MDTKVFRLGANGLEEIQKAPILPIYSRVYAYGFSMQNFVYAVISGPDKKGTQRIVKMNEHYEGDYFGPYQNTDNHIQPHSKKFGIGFYYDDQEPDFRFSESEVKEAIKRADQATKTAKEKTEQKAQADKEEMEKLPSLFPYLTPIKGSDKNQEKKNLIAELKRNFPGIKFSIRRENYDSVYIRWTNGPTETEVDNIVMKFEDHCNDWSGDYRDYSPSNFNKVFGGFKYVFTSRQLSEDIRALFVELGEMLPESSENDLHFLLGQIIRKESIPVKAKNFRIVRTNTTCGQEHEFYKLVYTLPGNNPKEGKTGGVEIVEYSDKAIAVIGNTKPIKDELKALGGRFNFRLSCGPGWIFPKRKKAEIENII